MTKILEVSNLCKSFGGVRAVNNVSFDMQEGELVALIGPNGAGKSTCFNLINGQLAYDQGKVKILGNDTNNKLKPRHVWKLGVGRTFQITATFASMTVLENIQMVFISKSNLLGSVFKKAANLFVDESMELLKLVGIQDQFNRQCGILAYGDLKRLELAIALANKPKILLMDEPTAGMGPKERLKLMELTSNIVRTRSIGVLFTEHDMDVVFAYADRIIVLNYGSLIAHGTPEEILNDNRVREIYFGTFDVNLT